MNITGNYISCGQVYVALSRVKEKKNLSDFSKKSIFADDDVSKFYKRLKNGRKKEV